MSPLGGSRSESGAATLEVMVLGIVLIVPLIWLLGVLAELHRVALATDAAVREVGWEVAHDGTPDSIDSTAAAAFADHGLEASDGHVWWEGSTERGQMLVVRAAFPVRVASFPLLGSLSAPTIVVEATHRVRVPSFRSRS